MAHIELNNLPVVGASDNIFTANLTLDPTVKDTIIRTIKDGGDKQNRTSNVQATIMTDWSMQNEPGFVDLEKEINSIINYIPKIFSDTRDSPMVIGNMWGMCYKKNDYTKVHSHWPATWSGVFYLDIPTDYAGTLFFPELEHNIEPITGQLVIFSGTTKHGVDTIKSNGERLAISFNYGALWNVE
jgi:hypothetical protein|tara:strand:- start:281 stop:835 length:555 start_codon:yes stop_codon:yes gene_type:complete